MWGVWVCVCTCAHESWQKMGKGLKTQLDVRQSFFIEQDNSDNCDLAENKSLHFMAIVNENCI